MSVDARCRAALDEHLEAISRRDLQALEATIDPDEVVLVTATGEVLGRDDFLRLHADWFQETDWSLRWEILRTVESEGAAVAVLRLDYRDEGGAEPVRKESVLTLTFRWRDGRWLMVHDQNTPRRA